MICWVDRYVPLSLAPILMTHHFFQVVLYGLALSESHSFLVDISGFSSALWDVNLLCIFKPLEGIGALLFVPEVTSFHPSLSLDVALTMIVGTLQAVESERSRLSPFHFL